MGNLLLVCCFGGYSVISDTSCWSRDVAAASVTSSRQRGYISAHIMLLYNWRHAGLVANHFSSMYGMPLYLTKFFKTVEYALSDTIH